MSKVTNILVTGTYDAHAGREDAEGTNFTICEMPDATHVSVYLVHEDNHAEPVQDFRMKKFGGVKAKREAGALAAELAKQHGVKVRIHQSL